MAENYFEVEGINVNETAEISAGIADPETLSMPAGSLYLKEDALYRIKSDGTKETFSTSAYTSEDILKLCDNYDGFQEFTYNSNKTVNTFILWEDNSKINKIYEELYYYNSNKTIDYYDKIIYDPVSITIRYSFTYSGKNIINIDGEIQ